MYVRLYMCVRVFRVHSIISSLCFFILYHNASTLRLLIRKKYRHSSLTRTYTHTLTHSHTYTHTGREKDKHLCIVLRLFCLQSLSTGGIRAGRFDGIRKLIAQTYGFRHMFTISNLEKAGLIVVGLTIVGVGGGDINVINIITIVKHCPEYYCSLLRSNANLISYDVIPL